MVDGQLGTDILKAVSRSFYLTLRLLPPGFRDPASLGYLLARLSDTIADAGTLELPRRAELLESFRLLLSAPAKRGEAQRFAQALPGELKEAGLTRGEWDLVMRAGDCLDWLDGMDRSISRHVRKVVGIITEGQAWDLVRFAGEGVVRLRTAEELEHYAYQVAGCVGEFWTEIGYACTEQFSPEERHVLREWGANYGKGLQLVNILRDLPEDLERGRCYLPGDGEATPPEVLGVASGWRERARVLLQDGLRYTAALRGVKLKAATGLPALLGLQTLERLEGAGWADLERGVKISRLEVKRSGIRALMASLPVIPCSWTGILRRTCQESRTPHDRDEYGTPD